MGQAIAPAMRATMDVGQLGKATVPIGKWRD